VTFSLIFNIEKFVSCGSSCRLKLVLRLPQDLKPSISYLSFRLALCLARNPSILILAGPFFFFFFEKGWISKGSFTVGIAGF
jgi:hypothetical protein